MELYRKVRLARRSGMSERAAAVHFGVSRAGVKKIMGFSVPPGYRRMAEIKRPKLDGFTGLIDQWLSGDLGRNRKQRHTAQRVFKRLRDEHGFKGGQGHRDVWLRDYVDRVVISCGGNTIARQPRCWDREDMVFDPVHYLPLLQQKTPKLVADLRRRSACRMPLPRRAQTNPARRAGKVSATPRQSLRFCA